MEFKIHPLNLTKSRVVKQIAPGLWNCQRGDGRFYDATFHDFEPHEGFVFDFEEVWEGSFTTIPINGAWIVVTAIKTYN